MAKKFYVVWEGRETGIFTDWDTCRRQVDKFPKAKYKSFPTLEQAETAFSGGKLDTVGHRGKKPSGSTSVEKKSVAGSVKTYNASEIQALEADTKIFTDGGCEPNPGNAGSGIAVYRDNAIAELWYGLFNPEGTNNTAELNALNQALHIARSELAEGKNVVIFCDSKYSIQAVTQWAAGWERKGWKRKDGEVKNLDLIKPMYVLYQSLKGQVQVLHVNGHVGVEGNELADRMSIQAMQSRETEFVRYSDPIDITSILAMRSG